MHCPSCKKAGLLQSRVYEGVEIDTCANCRGSWLDEGELVKILEIEEESFPLAILNEAIEKAFQGVPKQELATEELCPKCSKPMSAINYSYSSGIILDRCREHGVWLNHQELEKLQAHHEHWNAESQTRRDDWKGLVSTVRDSHHENKKVMEENQKKNMGPTQYVISSIFKKMLE